MSENFCSSRVYGVENVETWLPRAAFMRARSVEDVHYAVPGMSLEGQLLLAAGTGEG